MAGFGDVNGTGAGSTSFDGFAAPRMEDTFFGVDGGCGAPATNITGGFGEFDGFTDGAAQSGFAGDFTMCHGAGFGAMAADGTVLDPAADDDYFGGMSPSGRGGAAVQTPGLAPHGAGAVTTFGDQHLGWPAIAAVVEEVFGRRDDAELQRVASSFSNVVGPDGFVSAEDGKNVLEKSGLQQQVLGAIWDLSDLDCDGRLSRREFACALLLASMANRGAPLPADVSPEQQVALVELMDNRLAAVSKGQIEDWSALDTAATAPRQQHHRGQGGKPRRSSSPKTSSRRSPDGDPLGPMFDSLGELSLDSAAVGLVHEFESTPDAFGTQDIHDGAMCRGRPMMSPRSHRASTGNRSVGSRDPSALGAKGVREPGAGASGIAGEAHFDAALKGLSRLGAPGEMERLGREALQERQELGRQLARRRECEQRFRDSHRRVEGLGRERSQVDTEVAYSKGSIARMKEELGHMMQQIEAAEAALALIRSTGGKMVEDAFALGSRTGDLSGFTSGGATSSASRRKQHATISGDEERLEVVISRVRGEKEQLHQEQKAVEDMRRRLTNIVKEKMEAQATQQALLERQRQNDQDRTLAIAAIEAERAKLSAIRQDRMQVWEERLVLERDVAALSAGWHAIRLEHDLGMSCGVPGSAALPCSAAGAGRQQLLQPGGVGVPRAPTADAGVGVVHAGAGYPGSGPGQGHGVGRAAAPGRGAPDHQNRMVGVPAPDARTAKFGSLSARDHLSVASVH